MRIKYKPTPITKGVVNYEVKCLYCGQTFGSNRSTRKFCSNMCGIKFREEKRKKPLTEATEQNQKRPKKEEILNFASIAHVRELIKERFGIKDKTKVLTNKPLKLSAPGGVNLLIKKSIIVTSLGFERTNYTLTIETPA